LGPGAWDQDWPLRIAPILLGGGERPLDGVGNLTLEPTEVRGTRRATHVRYKVTP
jgi:hypothetical protein